MTTAGIEAAAVGDHVLVPLGTAAAGFLQGTILEILAGGTGAAFRVRWSGTGRECVLLAGLHSQISRR